MRAAGTRAGAFLAVMLVSLAAGVTSGAPGAEASDACPASAVVEGSPASLVAEVRAALAAAHLQPVTSAGCPAVQATITGGGDRLPLLRIRDPHGRTSVRRIASAGAAAAVIESWARADFTAALMRGRPPAAAVEQAAGAQANVAEQGRVGEPRRATGQARPPGAPPSLAAEALAESAVGSDGSAWSGGAAGLCLALQHFCLGPAVRLASSDDGRAIDGLISARLLATDGPYLLTPVLALGYGWRQRAPHVLETGAGAQQGAVGEVGPVSSYGLRVEAHLALAIRLAPWLAVDMRVGLGGPLSRTEDDGPPVLARGGLGLRFGWR